MPGFGHGPFGHMAFGEWWWSRYVLYDLIPSVYRDRDAEGFLEKFSESLRPSFDQLRRKIRDFGELRDPLLVRAAATETQVFRLGKKVVLHGPIEQTGVDGKVVIYGEFSAATARFTPADKGKELTIRRSSKPENNRVVSIVSVVSPTVVSVSPRLSLDAGPVRWNVRQVYTDPPNQTTVEIRSGGTELGKVAGGWLLNDGYASFDIRDRKIFPVPADERTLLTEREGDENGTIDSQGRLSTTTYQFSNLDIGKTVFIAGSQVTSNNGRFEIHGVDALSPTDVRAVFSRLDVPGMTTSGLADYAGSVRYANKAEKQARVQHVKAGLSTPFSIVVVGSDITVNLATDGLGNVTTTAAALVAAITSDIYASALVTVVATGTGTGLVAPTLSFTDVPGSVLTPDQTLTWALIPFGRLVLKGPVPRGIVEADGNDGYIQATSATEATLKATSTSPFRAGDAGKLVIVKGSSVGNDGTYEINEVPVWGAGSVVKIKGVFATEPVNTTVYWEMRTKSANSDTREVVANAPSMLSVFAKDFGIEIDTQESEARQRSWVKYINEWVDKKGLAKAYQILAAISGYSASVSQLYNITYEISLQLPSPEVFEITDKFGEDGVFSDAFGPEVTLSSAVAPFSGTDIGKYVRIQLAASGANNQLFQIIGYFDPNSIRLKALGSVPTNPVAPDANNGALRWAVVRLYTSVPPLRPNFDDFDSDQMGTLLPGFTVDLYCWEYPIKLGVGGGGGALNIVGTAQQVDTSFVYVDGDIDVIENLGLWALTDSLNRTAFLETLPMAILSIAIGAGNSSVSYFGFDPTYGFTIRVAHVNPGPSNPNTTVAVVFGVTTDITVTLRTDGGGAVLATAQEVVNAVSQDLIAAPLVSASIYPGNGTGLAATAGLTALTSNGVYRTSIGSSIPLALGAAGLEYVCEPNLTCDFCISYRILLELELDALFDEDNAAFERVFERTLERLKDVTPAHVELVPRVVQPITATWNWLATVEPVETLAVLFAPWSLYYDDAAAAISIIGNGDTIGGAAPNMTLTDAAGLFTPSIVGANLVITGATTPANNGVFLITGYTSPTVISYSNAAGVAEAFTGGWAVSTSVGFVDAEVFSNGDSFGGVAPTMTLTDSSALFTPALVGMTLIVTGATSPANNGSFPIIGYTSPTVITFTNAAGVAEAFTGAWGVVLYEVDGPLSATITTPP